jgi:hypothetical protein
LVSQVLSHYKTAVIFAFLPLTLHLWLSIGPIITHNVVWQVAAALASGFIAGLASTFLLTKFSLKNIAQKGKSKDSFLYWIIAFILTVFLLSYLVFSYTSNSFLVYQINLVWGFFMWPYLAAGILMYFRSYQIWEHKNQKTLYTNFFTIYPYPYITSNTS